MEQSPRKHVLITGIGRAGTSFLMQLLTNLGLDTGFSLEQSAIDENARAGMEIPLNLSIIKNSKPESWVPMFPGYFPYIIKDTWFIFYPNQILESLDIILDHVFIPMRDLHGAAESRRFVQKKALQKMRFFERMKVRLGWKELFVPGGLWPTQNKEVQETLLAKHFYGMMLALSKTEIPITMMNYPRIIKDSRYLFQKLTPILKQIEYDKFSRVFNQTVNINWVHSFGKGDK
jgi:hypothetical protein